MSQRKPDGDLYRVVHKKGTHLAPSKVTEGAVRGTLLNDETNQIDGQAELIKVDKNEYGYDEPYYYQEPRQEKDEAQELAKLVGEIIAAGTIRVLDEVVAPRVRFLWQEKAAPVIKEMWGHVKSKKKSKKTRGLCKVPKLLLLAKLFREWFHMSLMMHMKIMCTI